MNRRPGDPVTVIGAGIAGAACAVALRVGRGAVRVIDAAGRRAAGWPRRCCTAAGGSTWALATSPSRDPGFAAVVPGLGGRGLARPWTDSFGVLTGDSRPGQHRADLRRWATPDGLRSLVRDLLTGIEVLTGTELTEPPAGPAGAGDADPQAGRLCQRPRPGAVLGHHRGRLRLLRSGVGPLATAGSSTTTRYWSSSPTTGPGAVTAGRCWSRTPPPALAAALS